VIAYPIFVISNALPTTELDPNQTIQVEANSVAASAGFLAGDHIVAMRDIEDKPVTIGVDDGDQAAVFDQIAITVDTSEFNYHVVFFQRSTKNTAIENYFTLIADEHIPAINSGELSIYQASLDSYPGYSSDFIFDVTVWRGEINDQGTSDEADDTLVTTVISLPMHVERTTESIAYRAVDESASLGISFETIRVRQNFIQVLKSAGEDYIYSLTAVGEGIISLFTPSGIENVGGIVMVFEQTANTFTDFGFGPYLMLWGFISVNLALFNLLPFPGLDGWHLLVVAIESITRRELPKKFKSIASTVGVLLLVALIVLITIRDIIHLF
jgi:membrane-associated protease RseP (regulator of RpoE activity)